MNDRQFIGYAIYFQAKSQINEFIFKIYFFFRKIVILAVFFKMKFTAKPLLIRSHSAYLASFSHPKYVAGLLY
jgi:hypothetical protein